jgi:hypothetical protein
MGDGRQAGEVEVQRAGMSRLVGQQGARMRIDRPCGVGGGLQVDHKSAGDLTAEQVRLREFKVPCIQAVQFVDIDLFVYLDWSVPHWPCIPPSTRITSQYFQVFSW